MSSADDAITAEIVRNALVVATEEASMIGRRRTRSTHAPAGSPISSQGAQAAAVSRPTWKVVA